MKWPLMIIAGMVIFGISGIVITVTQEVNGTNEHGVPNYHFNTVSINDDEMLLYIPVEYVKSYMEHHPEWKIAESIHGTEWRIGLRLVRK